MKRQLFAILVTILTSLYLSGQSQKIKKIETGNWLDLSVQAIDYEGQILSFDKVGQLPKFPGGYDSLATFLLNILSYPESAIKDSIEGRVLLSFTVDSIGQVGGVEIIKGVRNDIDSICVHGIRKIPDWRPGLSWNNKPVKFKFGLPIRFKLK